LTLRCKVWDNQAMQKKPYRKRYTLQVETTPQKGFAFSAFAREGGMSAAGAIRVAVKKTYGYDLSI